MRALLAVPLLIAWAVALLLLAVVDVWAYVVLGAVLTVAVGAWIERTWILGVPLGWAIVALLPLALSDENLGWYDDTWAAVVPTTLFVFVVPATIAFGLGIALRRARRRSRPPAPPAPSHAPGPPAPPPPAPPRST
jgi:hypothetical protein